MSPPYRVDPQLDGDVWVIRATGIHGEAAACGLQDVERIARKFIAMIASVPSQTSRSS